MKLIKHYESFISCRLDYCNSSHDACDGLIRKLQSMQNAACLINCTITSSMRCTSCTSFLFKKIRF